MPVNNLKKVMIIQPRNRFEWSEHSHFGFLSFILNSFLISPSVTCPSDIPGSLLDQLSHEQRQQTEDLDDHGFTDDCYLANDEMRFEQETVAAIEGQVKNIDVGLCKAIEKTFLDLTKVAVIKHQDCAS